MRSIYAFIAIAGGSLFSAVGSFVALRVLTTALAPTEFAEVSLALSAMLLASNVVWVPLASGVTRVYCNSTDEARRSIVRMCSFTLDRVAISAAIVVFIAVVLGTMAGSSVLVIIAVSATSVFVADGVRLIGLAIFNAEERHTAYSAIVAGDSWSRTGFVTALALTWASASSALLGYALGAAVVAIVVRVSLLQGFVAANVSFDRALGKQVARFAVPLAPMAITGWVSATSDRFLLAGTTSSLSDVGLFVAAYSLVSRPMLIVVNAILNSRRPRLYRTLNEGSVSARRSAIAFVAYTSVVSAIVATLLILFRTFIAEMLLGSQFSSASSFIPWLAIGHVFLAMSFAWNTVSLGLNRPAYALTAEGCGAGASIVAVAFLAARYGAMGAAAASCIYYGLQAAVSQLLAFRALSLGKGTPMEEQPGLI